MNKQKIYNLMKMFKDYYDYEKNALTDDAPEEAVLAFQEFNKLYPKLPSVEDQPDGWKNNLK